MSANVTRFRIEAKGDSEKAVKQLLVEAAEAMTGDFRGPRQWEVEKQEIQTCKDGYWGYEVWREKVEDASDGS